MRVLSSKLVFLVLEQDGHHMQIVCSLSRLSDDVASDAEKKSFRTVVRKGDWFGKLFRYNI